MNSFHEQIDSEHTTKLAALSYQMEWIREKMLCIQTKIQLHINWKKRLKTAQLECNNVTKGKKQLLLLCERILIASKYLVAYIFFNQKSKVWLRFLISCIPLIVNFQSKFTAILLLKQSIVNGLTVDVLLSKFFSTRDPLIYLGIVDFNVQLNRMSVELQVPNTTAVWLLCMHRPESRWMNHWRWN